MAITQDPRTCTLHYRFSDGNQLLCRVRLFLLPVEECDGFHRLDIRINFYLHEFDDPVYPDQQSSYFCMSFGNDGRGKIDSFVVPYEAKGKGVSRYLWHVIKVKGEQLLPASLRVNGMMSLVDDTSDNRLRRDTLWQDVIGFGVHPDAVFVPQVGEKDGYFEGILHSPWNGDLSPDLVVEPLS